MLGQYISEDLGDIIPTTELHRLLINAITSQDGTLVPGLDVVANIAVDDMGTSRSFIVRTLHDEDYIEREIGLFLHALHFVLLHERCHLFLDRRSEDIDETAAAEREIEADSCAIDIINADESQYSGSPISIIAVLMTISTHVVLEYGVPELYIETGQHPSAYLRFIAAVELVDEFLSGSDGGETAVRFAEVASGVKEYFEFVVREFERGSTYPVADK